MSKHDRLAAHTPLTEKARVYRTPCAASQVRRAGLRIAITAQARADVLARDPDERRSG